MIAALLGRVIDVLRRRRRARREREMIAAISAIEDSEDDGPAFSIPPARRVQPIIVTVHAGQSLPTIEQLQRMQRHLGA